MAVRRLLAFLPKTELAVHLGNAGQRAKITMRRNRKSMAKQEMSFRPELRAADDAVLEDAIAHADPMVLRGLLYQLTGDPEVAATGVKTVLAGYFDVAATAGGGRPPVTAPRGGG